MAYTTIDNPELYFQVKLYTGGNGSATTISGLSFQPDMVWCKGRSYTGVHAIMDDQRSGANGYGWLRSESTDAENNTSGRGNVSSWTSDGFVLSADSWSAANYGTNTHVAWCWKESATAGFDIVSYAGNGSAGLTVSHSLSAVPKVMIIKNRSGAYSWAVYHGANTSAPETETLFLDVNDATADRLNEFNDTAPTSSLFTVGNGNSVNNSSENFIAYLFAEKQGFSKFGSYTGNGNADGPFCFTGFKPAFVLTKTASAAYHWSINDNKRNTFNPTDKRLYPSTNGAEATSDSYDIDFLSNGFKIRSSSVSFNASGDNVIYMAFAENPFVNSNGVPCNAR